MTPFLLARVHCGSPPSRYLVASHHELATGLAIWTPGVNASPQPAQWSPAQRVRPPNSRRAELAAPLRSR